MASANRPRFLVAARGEAYLCCTATPIIEPPADRAPDRWPTTIPPDSLVTDRLREQIQASLGAAYTLERELGGGGMSRVFVATETALGRKVVVKVLSPELAAGVSVERFNREIQLAAQLQQANIVPVHAAGEVAGLPFYTMPLVEGESLRARLAAGGALPQHEVVSILRDVARALAYAHARGIVHRDIKPDNVLLSGGAAVVTDFGIAKALSAARHTAPGGEVTGTLTAVGTSIGTPAYMAPEQAAGDPHTDHRADIYALGIVAYEMLAGQTPFAGRTPQSLLAAQMAERPEPVTQRRPDCAPTLGKLVMHCLEKDAAARPQSAVDVLRELDGITTPSGGAHEALPVIAMASRKTLGRALGLYALAFLIVALLARAAIVAIGLPDWVFPGALIVMALGLPVLLFTGFVHHQSRVSKTLATTYTPGGSPEGDGPMARLAVKASPHVSWRRAAWGGVWAVAGFAVLVATYMVLRALGIGPAGSLLAKGVIGDREKLLIADFKSPPSDSTLGPVVTEAFRTDLAQSQNIVVSPSTTVRDVLQRMKRPPDARVDFALAREVATREGIKAIIDGEILSIGGHYILSARLVATQTGEELARFRETADDASDIIPAIGELSKAVRAKIGESLRTVRAAPPLEQVTTASLEALKKYAQGVRAIEIQGDFSRAISLLEEATTIDTSFAMAYRKLAIELSNRGLQRERAQQLLQKAYDHRDRLSDREKYMTVGSYWYRGPKPDRAKAIAAYEALIEIEPGYTPALNNIALLYGQVRDFAKAEEYLRRAVSTEGASAVRLSNLVSVQVNLGKPADARQTVATLEKAVPGHPIIAFTNAELLSGAGDFAGAARVMDSLGKARSTDVTVQSGVAFNLGDYALARGRLSESKRWWRAAQAARGTLGSRQSALTAELDEAWSAIWFFDDTARATRALDSALARNPMDSIPEIERPYNDLAGILARTGRIDRARAMAAAWERAHAIPALDDASTRHHIRGDLARAERNYEAAIREFRAADVSGCTICALPFLGEAYDLAGQADSAIAVYERYIRTPWSERSETDAPWLAGIHKRLGELYEARGDKPNAASHYAKFVELWKDADPALQPRVREVGERLARLQREGR
jgi:eukaryotic-like serine/threonine-protein kinase